jgi:hypothetical protein
LPKIIKKVKTDFLASQGKQRPTNSKFKTSF